MINIVCFCGTQFQFEGDVGVCPCCGEYAVMKWPSSQEQHEMTEEMRQFLSQLQMSDEDDR